MATATASNLIEVNGVNISADTLRVAQMMTEGKLILRTIQPRVKKEKADKAICPCAVPIVSIRVASDAIQRQYPKDGGEVPMHLGIYIVTHDKIERAYKKCTRPLLHDKKDNETREYCYKHWETHQNASANLYLFDDIVRTGRLAQLSDSFFETAKQTGRKKKASADDASDTQSVTGKRSVGTKLLDIRIPLTAEIFARLKKFQEDATSDASPTPSPAPQLIIKPAAPAAAAPATKNESILNATAEEASSDEDASGTDDEEEEVEAEDITTTTGEALSLVESNMTVYRTNPETEDSDEIGVMVEVDSKTKKHAVTHNDKKYIIAVPLEHNDVEYYQCVITEQLFTKKMPATLVGTVKKNAKGEVVVKVNAKK